MKIIKKSFPDIFSIVTKMLNYLAVFIFSFFSIQVTTLEISVSGKEKNIFVEKVKVLTLETANLRW